jgi:hypothetical protein
VKHKKRGEAMKAPKTLGQCADLLFDLKEEKARLNKQIADLEEKEKFLKNHLIETVNKEDSSGVQGKKARVQVKTKEIPVVKEWESFYSFVLKTKDFSLLQRRLNDGAVKERWESGKVVPGVETFHAVTVSVTKL